MSYKNLLAYLLTLVVGLTMTACPDSECDDDLLGGTEVGGALGGAEDCEEGGALGGETGGAIGGETGGMTGGETGGAEEPVYNTLVVFDTTGVSDDDNGTPGADICEIDIVCNGETVSADDITVYLELSTPGCSETDSSACICDGERQDGPPSCGTTDRSDDISNDSNDIVVYDTNLCEDGDDPYVSLGSGGRVIIEVAGEDVDLRECEIAVYEAGEDEAYGAEVCPELDSEDCVDAPL